MRPTTKNDSLSGKGSIRVGQFVLEGNSILCQCPSCQSPMSVRMWLLEAECWQCGTRIAISEATRAALEAAMQERAASPVVSPRVDAKQEVARPKISAPAMKVPMQAPSLPVPKPMEAPVRTVVEIRIPPVQESRRVAGRRVTAVRRRRSWWEYLEQAPAWLISLLVHLVLLILLAVWTQVEPDDRGIVLSLSISKERKEGDQEAERHSTEANFSAPLAKKRESLQPTEGMEEEAVSMAKQLSRAEYAGGFEPAPVREVQSKLRQPYDSKHGLLARDLRLREEILAREGGTLQTEAAVARGLKWLAKHQQKNGAWRLDSIAYDPGRGMIDSDAAATALALLPFLGAGQTPTEGIYRKNVQAGVRYLMSLQGPDGDMRADVPGEAGMYVQGQATIVLCEAYAMTRDPKLKVVVERAVQFIIDAQHRRGGWRYEPGQRGDTSVLGWQLMALQSAKMAGLEIPDATLSKASRFLDSVSDEGGTTYAYQPGHGASANMTAEALLCRFYLGSRPEEPMMRRSLDTLLSRSPPSLNHIDYYYWYYATQAFHHAGGSRWRAWNQPMQDVLVSLQVTEGKHAGSWEVDGYMAEIGGRVYVTSLAICTLEVYYRHLPLFHSLTDAPSRDR